MNIYSWDGVACAWNCGTIYVIADNLIEARQFILNDYKCIINEAGDILSDSGDIIDSGSPERDVLVVMNNDPTDIVPVQKGFIILCEGSA